MFSQIIKNGSFSSTASWLRTTNAIIANGRLTVTVTGGGYERAYQSVSYIPGRTYRLTAIVNGTATYQMRFRDAADDSGGLPANSGRVVLTGSPQRVEFEFTANANSNLMNIERDVVGDYSWTVDELVVSLKTPFNDIIKPADVPTPIFNDIIRTYAGEEPWQAK